MTEQGLEGKEIHVCRGVGRYYTAQARRARARKFESVGEKYRTAHGAARELAAALLRGDGVEGQVIAWSDWYEPAVVLELRRT